MLSVNINNECLICLEDSLTNSTKQVESILAIPYINKSCKCHYFVHSTCLFEWLNTKPVCPFCKNSVFIEEIIVPLPSSASLTKINANIVVRIFLIITMCFIVFFLFNMKM